MSEPGDYGASFNWLEIFDLPIAFHRIFVDLTGSVHAALMLSQAFYWSNPKRNDDPDGWFFESQEKWEAETGLKRYEQEGARAKLRKTPFWHEEKRGIPARLYYRIDLQALQNQLAHKNAEKPHTCMGKNHIQAWGKVPNLSAGFPHSIKETSEETSEEKDPPLPPRGSGRRVGVKRKGARKKKVVVIDFTPANDYSTGFRAFWAAYPESRKRGKREAWAIWQARGLEARTDEIVEKVEALKCYCPDWLRGRDPEPHRWLKNERYEDDLAKPTQQTLVANGTISEKTRQSLNGVAEFQRRWRNRNGDDGRQRRPVLSLAGQNDGDVL
jgi:hypothetical protein